jgi:tripartite-type tricarboxylate transporter receptor subunit TctC
MNRRFLLVGLGMALLLCSVLPVTAAEFPSRPVSLIVPWAPGGFTDVVLRVLAETSSKYLGQPIVVDNRPGGGGTVGVATMAATAKPDGYTVAQFHRSVIRYPYMMKVNYDVLKDFTYIIHLTGHNYGVVVKADSPWKTWNEFIAYAKANPGKVTYATPGTATSPHIAMETIALKQGIKWTHVPMKGGAEATMAVLGGHVMAMADPSSWAPQVESGDFRLLVTWGNKRTKTWPNVPTLKELGYGMVYTSPFGIAGPKGMNPKVIKTLHDAFKKGMEQPAFENILAKFDLEADYRNSEDYAKFVNEQSAEEKLILEKLGLAKK